MHPPSFQRLGAMPPTSPIVLSVPHAGRDYPPGIRAALNVPIADLLPLEDRHVDTVALAARTEQTTIVQNRARAWIDLNRREDERDPRIDEGAAPIREGESSAKLRSGLGLVPRRASGTGDIWARRFTDADIADRIDRDHRPYHATLAEMLAAARARFGVAVLLDLHSMPPLGPAHKHARIVIGDRFGHTADARFVARIAAERRGIATAYNAPYAGGHILERHGDPANGIHAIQLELDRSLYLDRRYNGPGTGFTTTVAMVRAMIVALTDEALGGSLAAAAE